MKLHVQTGITLLVTGTGPGWVRVNADEHRESLVLTPGTVHPGWAAAGFAGLTEADFSSLLVHRPEILLLGTGAVQRFPAPRLLRALTDAGIGTEVMNTAAACRTFNILAGEGRQVVAALLVE